MLYRTTTTVPTHLPHQHHSSSLSLFRNHTSCQQQQRRLFISDRQQYPRHRPRRSPQQIEVLRLYRECLKKAEKFQWTDENGVLWSDILRLSVREEFDTAKDENDPAVISRLILNGREAIDNVMNQFALRRAALNQQINDEVQRSRTDHPSPSYSSNYPQNYHYQNPYQHQHVTPSSPPQASHYVLPEHLRRKAEQKRKEPLNEDSEDGKEFGFDMQGNTKPIREDVPLFTTSNLGQSSRKNSNDK
eukprot:gb/GECH01011127.1/.p1 GENE.gb/GECH01011127.1/~~gb/GECH01011127.1/.p1  ORF type:complete len:246 (+),score=52.42 gb/GECH01011127.1/:1-738(+)